MSTVQFDFIETAFNDWVSYVKRISYYLVHYEHGIAREQKRYSSQVMNTANEYKNIIMLNVYSFDNSRQIISLAEKIYGISSQLAYGLLSMFDRYHFYGPDNTELGDAIKQLQILKNRYKSTSSSISGVWICKVCNKHRNGGDQCLLCSTPRKQPNAKSQLEILQAENKALREQIKLEKELRNGRTEQNECLVQAMPVAIPIVESNQAEFYIAPTWHLQEEKQ